jgi:hypothetical protein
MRLTLAGLAAAALLAAPAAASGSAIEHTVSLVTFEGSHQIEGVVPRAERFERWVAADRAHQVIRNAETGAIRGENAEEPGKFTAFDALRNEVWTLTGADANAPRGTFVRTLARQGEDIKAQISKGWLVKTGDATFLGRPAIKLESAADAPSEGNAKTTVVADATTFAPYERVTTGRENGHTFKQREVLESVETLPLADYDYTLYMGPDAANARRVTFSQQAKAMREANRKAAKPKAAKKKKSAKKRR